MKPGFRIVAGGADITANIRDRLLSLDITDEAELKSDEVRIRLDYRQRDGLFVALPSVGTRLEVYLGYEDRGLVLMGRYTIDQIKLDAPPLTLEVTGRAAAMADSFRSPTSRAWHDTTLGDIVRTIASEHGYQPRLNPALAAVPIAHEDQTSESSMAFLARLTGRFDAVAKPAAGFLVLAPRGETKAFDGRALPTVTLRPELLAKWSFEHNARDEAGTSGQAGGVKTVFWDKDAAQMEAVTTGSPPYSNVRFVTADKGDASGIAASSQNASDRRKKQFSATLVGDPTLQAEARLSLQGFPPGLEADWVLSSVKHSLTGKGYVCDIDAELYQPSQLNPADVTRF
jgi:phage protein D